MQAAEARPGTPLSMTPISIWFTPARATESSWYRDLRSPGGGDNLYLASILALRASDGELVWYYQVTPGDNWDYDATQPLMLADLKIGGTMRKVIMQASKNGFFYVLDRQTGQFISAKPFVNGVTWASGVDPKTGRPIESPTAYDGLQAVLVSPDRRVVLITGIPWRLIPPRAWYMCRHDRARLRCTHRTKIGHSNTTIWNRGEDAAYDGPLLAKFRASPHDRAI